MFYNANYQTAIVQVYEFMINNAGDIEKYTDTNALYYSRYSKYFHLKGAGWREFMIVIDIATLLILIGYSVKVGLVVRNRIYDAVRYKVYRGRWYEIIDVFVLAISYV